MAFCVIVVLLILPDISLGTNIYCYSASLKNTCIVGVTNMYFLMAMELYTGGNAYTREEGEKVHGIVGTLVVGLTPGLIPRGPYSQRFTVSDSRSERCNRIKLLVTAFNNSSPTRIVISCI